MHRRYSSNHSVFYLILYLFSLIALTIVSQPTLAFDDDKTISDIHLKEESFVDINANQFRKSLDLVWLDTLNGWRATGASISTDRLYMHTELRMNQRLSKMLNFGIEWQQEELYAKKPLPLPLIFADVYPLAMRDIGISFIGSPAYDKRQADIGYAITFGRRPNNYTRFSWLKVDMLYNDKNEFDDSSYDQFGESLKLEGAYKINQTWLVYYDVTKDTPLNFVFDAQTSRFKHEAYNYKANIIYRTSNYHFAGMGIRSMSVDKRLQETTNDDEQAIDYRMLDVYWVSRGFDQNRELTMGVRYDTFKERLTDHVNQNGTYHFELTTWQAYGSLFNNYSVHQAWDVGLYVAWSERAKDYVVSTPNEFDERSIQGKLRTSWQYHSFDKSSVLLLSISFNLDDLVDDPGDGGGIYYQTRF